jgi:penicillin-binding protein 1A
MRILGGLFAAVSILFILAGGTAVAVWTIYGRSLPDHTQLRDYDPPVTTRVYAGDGRLMAEYATEKRIFVPIDAIPERVIQAFLSAEDKNFYLHPGVDLPGIARAVWINLSNMGRERRPIGASTITQQVAKNFLLSNEVSIERKIREAILAVRMSHAFTKDRILELYLNEIFLGYGSYGVAAAALNYFNHSLNELTLAEAAFLAALPKAPVNYDPVRHPEAARNRRDWVLGRMVEDGHISGAEADLARGQPIAVRRRDTTQLVAASYFAEEVRRDVIRRFGETSLYEGGLAVHSTLDPRLQALADRALTEGLEAYDRRHGWRGPIARIDPAKIADWKTTGWHQRFSQVPTAPGLNGHRQAVVLELDGGQAQIGFADGSQGQIPLSAMSWARRARASGGVGAAPRRAGDVLAAGDIIAVKDVSPGVFALTQIPEVEGALVALDPHTGRILAMSGGYAYERSQFNRVTQAWRQPGSAFKPFVYLAALEHGYTPISIINDAPVSYSMGPGNAPWQPSNYSDRFYGPTTLRVGLELSRNVMTVRLADAIGMDAVVESAQRFRIVDDMLPQLTNALGAQETTLLRLTAAYGILVNGGRQIVPSLIDRVQDRYGRIVFRHDPRDCPSCQTVHWEAQAVPALPDDRAVVTDPHTAYQVVSMLEGVVQRGTARVVAEIGKPVAGKTGTSSESKDVWFVGFSPDLAVGVFLGFDDPRSLGDSAAGGTLAAPIFRDFMKDALATAPSIPFRIPPGVRLVRVDASTGRLARATSAGVILEAFKPGTVPQTQSSGVPRKASPQATPVPTTGTGGLY